MKRIVKEIASTIPNINRELGKRFPDIEIEFIKGKGYYYFVVDEFRTQGPDNMLGIRISDLAYRGETPLESVLNHVQDWYDNR